MLNTNKLLYILPDLAYVVDLLPGKKPHEFAIQNFKQINGEFFKGNKLIETSVKKLASKIDPGEYDLVLPDVLFTNTIVNVKESTKAKVKEYLETKVLADLNITEDSHLVETFILTEFKGNSKVQLASVQKSMLAPLSSAFANADAKIKTVYPVSWTLKSLVSLEPSITIVQLGSFLYMAKHYIGVDQPLMNKIEDTDRIMEAVKTLKGAEPSIQTAYLLSNELIEEELKEKLSDVLPIQQLASHDEEETKMPSYVSKAIEFGMKSISIEDFNLPEFKLDKVEAETGTAAKDEEKEETKSELPAPTAPVAAKTDDVKEEKAVDDAEKEKVEEEVEIEDLNIEEEKKPEKVVEEAQEKNEEAEEKPDIKETAVVVEDDKAVVIEDEEEDEGEIDLAQFVDVSTKSGGMSKKETAEKPQPKPKKRKKIVKNNDGIGSLVKVILIGIISFAVTVGVGVGIGFGVLKLTENKQSIETPVVDETEVTLTEAPEPTATPAPEIDKEELSIKVVNATTKAGYAGTNSSKLEDAGYGEVVAKNALGEYDEGVYLLMPEENEALVKAVAEDLEMEVGYAEGYETEDPNEEYDAVLVLAK